MSFGGSPVPPRLPLPYPEPCTLPEPILVCLELWKSLSKCFERAFCSPTLRASQLRGVLGKRWLSPWHPGCSARHRLFPINSMSVALPHFFSASSSPGAAQRLCGQFPLCAFGTEVMEILLGCSWQPPDQVPAPQTGSTGEPVVGQRRLVLGPG